MAGSQLGCVESHARPSPSLVVSHAQVFKTGSVKIHRLREKIRRHSRAGPKLPSCPPRESRLTLSGSDHMSISTPVEDTLCVFSKDERGSSIPSQ
ncbi:hypothetical protein GQ600_13677 [Phytophthora cactorum]|nr:hypothetical protein GQ600_13677 [Phytophthora cactorum]